MRQPQSQPPPKLLRALDSVVRGDRASAALAGSVVVAIKSDARAWFWHAAFDGDALLGCGYLDGLPRDADAILVFEEGQAADAIEGKKPKGEVATFGDHALLGAFVERYCTFRSFVDIRSSH